MPDLEKVIKGLEICSSGEWNSTGGRDHTSCPYYPAGYTGCTCKLLMRDALALLKEYDEALKMKPLKFGTGWRTMDDLISRAAAIEAFAGKPPEYYHTSYICDVIKELPAVDVVPVEWLNERHRKCCEEGDTDLMDAITVLCNEYHVWQKEQEAR